MNHKTLLLNNKVRALRDGAGRELAELGKLYDRFPETVCKREAKCCSLLPEMNGLEAISALRQLTEMPEDLKERALRRLLEYFFMNPVRIVGCPFLNDGRCIIYTDRFSGCRAYGIWSSQYYENIAAAGRRAKRGFQEEWKRAGVELPTEVVNFSLPYCRNVTVIKKKKGGYDKLLRKNSAVMDELSSGMDSSFHATFRDMFFSDFSFLAASMIWGPERAAVLKFEIVKESTESGDTSRLEAALGDVDLSPF